MGAPGLDTFARFCPGFWSLAGLDIRPVEPEKQPSRKFPDSHNTLVHFEHAFPSFARHADQWRAWLRLVVAIQYRPDIFPFSPDPGIADEHQRIYQRVGIDGVGQ